MSIETKTNEEPVTLGGYVANSGHVGREEQRVAQRMRENRREVRGLQNFQEFSDYIRQSNQFAVSNSEVPARIDRFLATIAASMGTLRTALRNARQSAGYANGTNRPDLQLEVKRLEVALETCGNIKRKAALAKQDLSTRPSSISSESSDESGSTLSQRVDATGVFPRNNSQIFIWKRSIEAVILSEKVEFIYKLDRIDPTTSETYDNTYEMETVE